jgi:Mg2+-importing ATPase
MVALRSRPEGLPAAEAKQRLLDHGPNTIRDHQRVTAIRLLLAQFANPLVLMLIFAVAVSASVGDWLDAAVVMIIVLGSGALGFAQEYRASTAVARLRARVTLKSTVLRDGHAIAIPSADIVPGDVVLLLAGSLIPGDGVVLEANDFFVNQAVLTGETFPVEKKPGVAAADASLADRANCVFMGSSVRSGTAHALIVETGSNTAYGRIAGRLERKSPRTEFEHGIHQFGLMLAHLMVALVVVVFAANFVHARPPVDSLLFAVALAVGLAPELLPAIFSVTLSKGAQMMAAHGVIIRRLSAIENLGSMDVLCTDKTGTLTRGVVRLDGALDAAGRPSQEVLRCAVLNAHFQTGLANPLDEAIQAETTLVPLGDYHKLGEIPYDFVRKRLSIVTQDRAGRIELLTKGALEPLLAICNSVVSGTGTLPLDEARIEQIRRREEAWNSDGFRVLGVARKDAVPQPAYNRADETSLTFTGFLLFFDPPKPDVEQTLISLRELGVTIKIITGDSAGTTIHLARAVGLEVSGILTGGDLQTMGDEALWHAAERTTLFVQVDPNQKERIIAALRKTGHVTGYLGDGINDAPALHAADVGISVDQAVDVAKEAADLVLLEHDLGVLRQGIAQGRKTFANTLKYIFTTTSANFGNVLSMAGASLFLPFLPLLAKQILLNNFLSDIPAMTIAGDHVDREWDGQPHRWDIHFIRRFMITFGLLSAVFDYLTFGMLLFWAQATPDVFRTAWFVESLLTELVITLVVRTRLPFYRSRPASTLMLSTLCVIALTLTLPYAPYRQLFGFVPLTAPVMALILAITTLYAASAEVTKRWFYRIQSPQ